MLNEIYIENSESVLEQNDIRTEYHAVWPGKEQESFQCCRQRKYRGVCGSAYLREEFYPLCVPTLMDNTLQTEPQ